MSCCLNQVNEAYGEALKFTVERFSFSVLLDLLALSFVDVYKPWALRRTAAAASKRHHLDITLCLYCPQVPR